MAFSTQFPLSPILLPRGNQCYSFLTAGINKYALISSSYVGFLFVFKEFFLFLCQRLGGVCTCGQVPMKRALDGLELELQVVVGI